MITSSIKTNLILKEIGVTRYSLILKEGQILVLKGAIEADDYKSKEMGDSMFRMRVKEVHSLDIELNRKIKEVTLDIDESNLISLEEFSDKLEKISDFFWKEGTCQLQVKVKANASEAIIEAGKKFKFQPTLENLNYLDDIFKRAEENLYYELPISFTNAALARFLLAFINCFT